MPDFEPSVNLHLVAVAIITNHRDARPRRLLTALEEAGHQKVTHIHTGESSENAEKKKELATWMQAQRRELFPRSFTIEQNLVGLRKAYWVEFWPESVEPEKGAGAKIARLTVTANRAANTIDVRCINVTRIKLLLNDELIDLSKEFKIRINDRVFTDRRQVSAQRLWENMLSKNDPEFLVTAETSCKFD